MGAFLENKELARLRGLVEVALAERLPSGGPGALCAAMRAAVMPGGKRLRPLLTLAVAEMLGHRAEEALDAACAVEMAHAASLILDDLPCMDDAGERRGLPPVHRVHGEATALLAAVSLLAEAFHLTARNAETAGRPEAAPAAVARLRGALGVGGLCGGQYLDLHAGEAGPETAEHLLRIHREKSGALFVAAAVLPAVLFGGPEDVCGRLERYAESLGLAFQISDDIIDAAHPTDEDGGSSLAGLDGNRAAEERARIVAAAKDFLAPWGDAARPLLGMADYVGSRSS